MLTEKTQNLKLKAFVAKFAIYCYNAGSQGFQHFESFSSIFCFVLIVISTSSSLRINLCRYNKNSDISAKYTYMYNIRYSVSYI